METKGAPPMVVSESYAKLDNGLADTCNVVLLLTAKKMVLTDCGSQGRSNDLTNHDIIIPHFSNSVKGQFCL